MKAIILAGGSGTRLWPVSREKNPKQLQNVLGGKTMLQNTHARLLKMFKPKDIVVATGLSDEKGVKTQLPKLPKGNLFVEPERRGTAAAIGLVLANLSIKDTDETFVVINSDAHVNDIDEYLACIQMAEYLLKEKPGSVVLIGVKPSYPETGYGYIHIGPAAAWVGEGKKQRLAHTVDKFVEKPDVETAKEYVSSGDYLWNPTLIVSTVGSFLDRYEEYVPQMHEQLMRIKEAAGTSEDQKVTKAAFKKMPNISVDNAILEHGRKMFVVPGEFDWSDIGHWKAVFDVHVGKEKNVTRGNVVCMEGEGNLICTTGKKLIATVGIKDMVVVDTDDALLVVPRDQAARVKQIVQELKAKGLEKYL